MGDEADFVNGLISGGLIGIISFAIIYLIINVVSAIQALVMEAIRNPGVIFVVALLMLALAFVIVFWIRLVRFIHRHTFVEEL